MSKVDRPEHERRNRDFLTVAFNYEAEALGAALKYMLITVGFVVLWRAGVNVLRGNTPTNGVPSPSAPTYNLPPVRSRLFALPRSNFFDPIHRTS
jgi:hypothetical protein